MNYFYFVGYIRAFESIANLLICLRDLILLLIYYLGGHLCVWESSGSMYKTICKVIYNLKNLLKRMPIENKHTIITKSYTGTGNSLKSGGSMEKVENDNGCSKDSRTWTKEKHGRFLKYVDKTMVSIWEQGCEMHVL